MLKIRLLKDGHVLDTVEAKWTINIAHIAREADELVPLLGADAWEIVNEADVEILKGALAQAAPCSLNRKAVVRGMARPRKGAR